MGKRISIYYLKFIYLFLIGAISLVIVDVLQLRIPGIIGKIIDGIDENTLVKSDLKEFIQQMIIIILIMFVGRFLWRIAITGTSHFVEADLKKKMFKHLQTMSIEYYTKNKNGSTISLFTSDVRMIRMYFGVGTLMIIDALFLGIYTFYKMLKLSVSLSLLSFIPLLCIAIISGILGHIMNLKFLDNQKTYDEITSYGEESFRGVPVIKAFARERLFMSKFKKLNLEYKNKNLSLNKLSIALEIITEVLVWTLGALIIGYGGYLAYNYKVHGSGDFSIGDLTKFFSYFVIINWPMFAVSRFIDLHSQAKASAKRINKLFDENPVVYDKEDSKYIELKGESIKFNNLSFNYPDDEELVLKNISFEIKKGEFIGVIGKTGSGKSSLFDILLRFYNCDKGMLYVDGYDIMDLKIKSINDLIGYVDQENFMFSDSIINNVCFAGEENNEELAISSMKMSNVYDNVINFTNSYNTILGERGVSISGGQKERLAISRALYKDPNVLILDDSLSAVDAQTEKEIINLIKNYRKDKITILSSNRISSVKKADNILVLDKGKVVGFAPHDELLKNCEIYQEIYNLQLLEGGDFLE